jgi:hypothetical protein
MYPLLALGWLFLLLATGLAFGLRPPRTDFPTRLVITLGFYSALVGLALWGYFGPGSFQQLCEWIGDSEGILVAIVLGAITVIGAVALTPFWGYAAGRTIRWYRAASNSDAASR